MCPGTLRLFSKAIPRLNRTIKKARSSTERALRLFILKIRYYLSKAAVENCAATIYLLLPCYRYQVRVNCLRKNW